jgi:hypothetical protein
MVIVLAVCVPPAATANDENAAATVTEARSVPPAETSERYWSVKFTVTVMMTGTGRPSTYVGS